MRDPIEIRRELDLALSNAEAAAQARTNMRAIQRKVVDDMAALKEELYQLDLEDKRIREELYRTNRREARHIEDISVLETELSKAIKGTQVRQMLDAEGEMLDIITEDAPWRQFAFEHQITGAKQLAIAKRGILGDKRGLGKTLTSIIWLDMLGVKKSIIFTSKEASTAYRKQMPRWAPHRPLFDLTSKSEAEKNAVLQALHFVGEWNILINFEAWRSDPTVLDKLVALQAEAVIIDEAHGIKDPRTNAYKGVEKVVYPYDTDGLNTVKHVLPMSGTVFLNYPDELWTLVNLVDRNDPTWYNRATFRAEYLAQGTNGQWIFDRWNDGKTRLLEKLGLRFVQRNREDTGVEIPPQEIVTHDIEFSELTHPRQWKAYQDLERKSAIAMSGMSEKQVMGVEGLALLTRLRQMITWPQGIEMRDPDTGELLFKCDVDESVKLDFAEELIDRIVNQEEDRVVVFSQFKAPLRELQVRLRRHGISTVVLDGSTRDEIREEIKRDFDGAVTARGDERWQVVLANYKVGGQSLDFTAAQQMVIIDREWSPGRHDQAFGRIDRIGQTRNTTVHILNTPNTVDDTMNDLNTLKADEYGLFEEAIRAATGYLQGVER